MTSKNKRADASDMDDYQLIEDILMAITADLTTTGGEIYHGPDAALIAMKLKADLRHIPYLRVKAILSEAEQRHYRAVAYMHDVFRYGSAASVF